MQKNFHQVLIKTFIRKGVIIFIYLFAFPVLLFSQPKKFYFVNEKKQPIQQLAVYNDKHFLIDITDANGCIKTLKNNKICLHNVIYGDTCFCISNDTVFLKPKVYRLKSVEIPGNDNAGKLLQKYLQNSKKHLIKDTVIYYRFNYYRTIKELNWNEKFSCVFKVVYNSVPSIYICDYQYSTSDSIDFQLYDKLLSFGLKNRLLKEITLNSYISKKILKESFIQHYIVNTSDFFEINNKKDVIDNWKYCFNQNQLIKSVDFELLNKISHGIYNNYLCATNISFTNLDNSVFCTQYKRKAEYSIYFSKAYYSVRDNFLLNVIDKPIKNECKNYKIRGVSIQTIVHFIPKQDMRPLQN